MMLKLSSYFLSFFFVLNCFELYEVEKRNFLWLSSSDMPCNRAFGITCSKRVLTCVYMGIVEKSIFTENEAKLKLQKFERN